MAGYNPNTYDWYQCDEENYDSGTPPDEQMATEPVQVDEDEVYTIQCVCGNRVTGTHDDLSAAHESYFAPCGHLWGDYRDITWAEGSENAEDDWSGGFGDQMYQDSIM